MSTYANLHPKYIFGLNESCKSGNVYFTENNQIAYPAGNTVVVLSLDLKTQTFLHGAEKYKGVSSLTVSYNRFVPTLKIKTHTNWSYHRFNGKKIIIYFSLYAAIGQIGDKPEISIFDLKTNKKRKTLQAADQTVKEFIGLAFTADNLHLGALTQAPDYNFVLWKWDRNRLVTTIKATGGTSPVYEVLEMATIDTFNKLFRKVLLFQFLFPS